MIQNQLKYNLLLLAFLLWLPANVFAQEKIALKQADLSNLPKGIIYEGKIKNAVCWADISGDNITILTETGIHQNKKIVHELDGGDAEIFAYNFKITKDSAIQAWRVHDFIYDCPVDIEARFIKNTFQITDLNHDGIGEIWMMYKTSCGGDVSPSDMKIIMYQGLQNLQSGVKTKYLKALMRKK